MAESIVTDWLADYSTLQEDELKTFAAQHEHNHDVASALFTIFNERLKYPDLVHSVCNQLHSFYRSEEVVLRRFTLQFTPVLIYIYLNSVAHGDKKSSRSVETLLICIYNIETTENDQPKVVSFRMPILAQASIYHEEKTLNAIDLRRWEQNSNKEVKWGPNPQVETLNAQNRLKVMTALLFVYNQQLSLIQKPSLYHLCRMTSQIVNQGFYRPGHAHRTSYGSDPNSAITPKPLPRIPISSQFLIELLHAVYFAMFNEFASFAIQTVDDVHHRACFELFPDTILVTNAIKNSLHANPSGQPSDGPMGISVALTPATTAVTVSKSMITNASFRTKKLPDDIPIQGPKEESGQLLAITEEGDAGDTQIGSRNTAARSSKENPKSLKVPFPGFKSKSKDKDKSKDVHKNGIVNEVIATKDGKEGQANKQTAKKDVKLLSKISMQSGDSVDSDKMGVTPLTIVLPRRPSITEGASSHELTPVLNGGDDKTSTTVHSLTNSIGTSESVESSPEGSADKQQPQQQHRNSIVLDIKAHNIQVSQV